MFVTYLAARYQDVPDATAPNGVRRVRLFEDGALQQSIDAVLATLPSDAFAATVRIGGNKDAQQLVAAVKLGEHWSMLGGLDHRKGQPWDFELGVTWWAR